MFHYNARMAVARVGEDFRIEDSSFLITGGTGSFGITIVKQLLDKRCKAIRVYSRDESKHHSLQNSLQDARVVYQIGDIRDPSSLKNALDGVDYVFHAAALKHVPASEVNPYEYVKTNIEGSHNLLSALQESKVRSAVFLSTDKAVYPVNAMGMTKALMEKLVRSSRYVGSTISCITRYGNVVGSRGSVIPLIIEKIKKKETIRITDWSMTRFMMSLEDSVSLVLFAMQKGKQGDLFVKKAPAATLRTILEASEVLLGQKAKKVEIVGVRPGEKIHETLLNAEERTYSRESKEYFQVPSIVLKENSKMPEEYKEAEYRSDSTHLLSTNELVEILLGSREIQRLI